MRNFTYFSGAQFHGKTIIHHGGPFNTANEVRDFQKWSCATSPEGYQPVVIELETKRNAEGKSEYVGEAVL